MSDSEEDIESAYIRTHDHVLEVSEEAIKKVFRTFDQLDFET